MENQTAGSGTQLRQIKFRAWDKAQQKWYEPIHEYYKGNLHELMIGMSGQLFAHTVMGLEHESRFPDRFLLQQYTGLKDKNGTEIYEGDLLEHNGNVYKVKHSKNQHVLLLANIDPKTKSEKGSSNWRSLEWCANVSKYVEIIGNIYQNPELLENNKG